ncbi:MAG TPA: penicillin-binding protein 1C [Anaerolineae bacterium]|nr:penicillin-binding protein 1C [Anaerolineae bacterium]HID84532.1 penicillin-binding protein 1C [Anaerolineales bacterium]HIQ09255.1 penicillin-binding protein 1C [Anaerolineaceae bacterium]
MVMRKVVFGVLVAVVVVGFFGGLWLHEILHDLPDPTQALRTPYRPPSLRITDRHGRLLYATLPQGEGRFVPLPPTAIPLCLKQATVAVEDATFYTNPGVDWRGMMRALWLDLRAGRVVAGGSTITQQVVRHLLLADEAGERTLRRKVREAVLAWRLTRTLSKDEILALYLNTTYYGGLAYGVEAAAQTYFGKPAAQLTLPECVLLAGLPQAPARYDPFTHPEAARARRDTVLRLMVRHGFLTPPEVAQAQAVPLSLTPSPYPMRAPHFVWMVLDQVQALQQAGRLPQGVPLVVRTTLDLDIQTLAEEAVRRHLAALRRERDRRVNNAAVVVLDAHTGALRALVGSADYTNDTIHGAVNMALAPRPTGSAFKPLIYAAALQPDQPHPWTEATVLWDVRTVFTTHEGSPYIPHNYDLQEHGPVTLRQALASSLNIPAVLTLQKVGLETPLAYAQRLGITSLGPAEEYDLSLALGGGEVPLLQLAGAYTAFAAGGRFRAPWWLYEVTDLQDHVLYRASSPPPRPVWDPRVAWLISDILSDDRARALGFGRHSSLEVGFPAAVKTGTSSGFHDNWAIGYTTHWVVGVWVGNADFQAMQGVDGLTSAAPIWHDLIRSLHQNALPPPFPQPDGLVRREVCTLSGLLPSPACRQRHLAWFIAGTEPRTADTTYRLLEVDLKTGALASPSTPPDRRGKVLALNLPPQGWAWARAQGWPLVQDFAPPSILPARDNAPLVVLRSPPAGSVYRLSPDLPAQAQKIPVEAETALAEATLRLWADGRLLAECPAPTCRAWWPLTPGEHTFWAEVLPPQGDPHPSATAKIEVEGRP